MVLHASACVACVHVEEAVRMACVRARACVHACHVSEVCWLAQSACIFVSRSTHGHTTPLIDGALVSDDGRRSPRLRCRYLQPLGKQRWQLAGHCCWRLLAAGHCCWRLLVAGRRRMPLHICCLASGSTTACVYWVGVGCGIVRRSSITKRATKFVFFCFAWARCI